MGDFAFAVMQWIVERMSLSCHDKRASRSFGADGMAFLGVKPGISRNFGSPAYMHDMASEVLDLPR